MAGSCGEVILEPKQSELNLTSVIYATVYDLWVFNNKICAIKFRSTCLQFFGFQHCNHNTNNFNNTGLISTSNDHWLIQQTKFIWGGVI